MTRRLCYVCGVIPVLVRCARRCRRVGPAVRPVVAVLALLGLSACDQFPHSDASLRICNAGGWGSAECGISLCLDWAEHYDRPYGDCPAHVRYGSGPR